MTLSRNRLGNVTNKNIKMSNFQEAFQLFKQHFRKFEKLGKKCVALKASIV